MLNHEDFKGCKAIVRETDTLEVLLETVILEHNRERSIITVLDEKKRLCRLDKVSVIILGRGSAYEFLGSTRRLLATSDRIELALYRCKITPIRAEERFLFNSEAFVESFEEKKSDMLRKLPFKVYVINISATGALIEPVHLRFEVGEIFIMRMQLGGTEVHITAEVLREEKDTHQSLRYGCRFLSVN